jgi:hypothetical protein
MARACPAQDCELAPDSGAESTQPNSRRHIFTPDEDHLLSGLVESRAYNNWSEIAQHMSGRTARQCRDRWTNYLAPAISFEPWRPEEDELIIQKVNEIGTKWATIAKHTNARTGNALKNRWYSGLKNLCSCDASGKWVLVRDPVASGRPVPRPAEPRVPQRERQRTDDAEREIAVCSWEQLIGDGDEGLTFWD